MGNARTSGGGIAKRALVLLTLCLLFAVGVGTAAASGNGGGTGNGKPGSPPGQGECEHGDSGKPCRDDPQPEHGEDCQAHGNEGGVNEDHCGGVTAPEPPPPTTTVNQPPQPTTVTTTTTAATTTSTTQATTSAPSSPSPPPTTIKTSPPAMPEPKQEDPREERAPSAAPPKATTPKPNDAPAKAKHETAEPKQGVKAAAAPGAENVDAGSAPPRVLGVAPKTAEGLPFTGLPLWAFVLGGLAALLAGVGVRRLARAGPGAAE